MLCQESEYTYEVHVLIPFPSSNFLLFGEMVFIALISTKNRSIER